MKKLIYVFLALFCFLISFEANAQMSATKDAQYMAVVTAVANYKINDEEHLKDVESLRENARFNKKLQEMLSELSNSRSKDSKNRKVLQILERTGKELYNLLD